MSDEKHTVSPKAGDNLTFGSTAISAGLEAWKAQPAAFAAYCSEVLTGAEAQVRRQADFLGQLARCKDLPEAVTVQTSFVQDFYTEAFRQWQKPLFAARKAFLPTAQS